MINEILGSSDYCFVRPISFHEYGIYAQKGINKAEVIAEDLSKSEAEDILDDNLVLRAEMRREVQKRMNNLGIERIAKRSYAQGHPMVYEDGEYKNLSEEDLNIILTIQKMYGTQIYLLKKEEEGYELFYVSHFPILWEEERKHQILN